MPPSKHRVVFPPPDSTHFLALFGILAHGRDSRVVLELLVGEAFEVGVCGGFGDVPLVEFFDV